MRKNKIWNIVLTSNKIQLKLGILILGTILNAYLDTFWCSYLVVFNLLEGNKHTWPSLIHWKWWKALCVVHIVSIPKILQSYVSNYLKCIQELHWKRWKIIFCKYQYNWWFGLPFVQVSLELYFLSIAYSIHSKSFFVSKKM